VVESTWPRIEAPVLLITGSESYVVKAFDAEPASLERRLSLLRSVEYVNLPGASHNLHHEAPEIIAELIETFLRADRREKAP
jgi:pimeloyl-ACP methyl ester carboxylesterase